MTPYLASVTLVVRDYDEAIEFFTGSLGFALVEDRAMAGGKRWVVVAPVAGATSGGRGEPAGGGAPDSGRMTLLLARAVTPEQESRIGNQAGGRVFLFLRTDDFRRDYAAFRERGVRFVEEPRQEEYGTVAVFLDLYGNKWDLVEPSPSRAG